MVLANAQPRVATGPSLRLAYITSRFPFGDVETFFLPEVEALEELVASLCIVPARAPASVGHDDALRMVGRSEREPLLSRRVLRDAALELARSPRRALRATLRLRASRSAAVLAKNLIVVPKALWLARLLRTRGIDHVHAHWGGSSSTLAMLAAEIADVPWSLTLHRWDIAENNLLATKLRSASFVRAISEHGARQIRSLVPGATVDVIHLGVETDGEAEPERGSPVDRRSDAAAPLRLLAVGDLVPVKDHDALLEAFSILRHRNPGCELRLDIAGDGPLRATLEAQAVDLGLAECVTFLGLVPHGQLLRLMRNGRWDAIVHTSLNRPDLHEGIPTALMEAMSAGLPAVAFRSGGVAELVRPGAGILVSDRDTGRFASAIEMLLRDPEHARELGERGRARVRAQFDARRIAAELTSRFAATSTAWATRP